MKKLIIYFFILYFVYLSLTAIASIISKPVTLSPAGNANENVLMIINRDDYGIKQKAIEIYNEYSTKFNIVMLIPMKNLKIAEQENSNYSKYLSEDKQEWFKDELIPTAKIDYSTESNIVKYLKSPNLKYIYYSGDGNYEIGIGLCTGLYATLPSSNLNNSYLNVMDISNIHFNKNQVWIANACHGADGEFPLELYKEGLRHYASGVSTLIEPFDSDIGLDAFKEILEDEKPTSVIANGELTSSIINAAQFEAAEYKTNPEKYNKNGNISINGVWGIIDGNSCSTFNVLNSINIYNQKLSMPTSPTIGNWPFNPLNKYE